MFRKSWRAIVLQRKRERCAAMRRAKERLRTERAESLRDVGGLVTDGCLGAHTIRLLAWPTDDRRLAVIVDGRHKQARTLRGVMRCVAEMINRKATK